MVPPKYAAVRVRMTQADKDAVFARAVRDDVPASVVIRRALRHYLNPAVVPAPKVSYLRSSDGQGGA
jgi:hypothetical protein